MQKNKHINAPARNVDYSSLRSKSMENRAGRIFDDPRKLTYQLVKKITNDFTYELGRGAFGRVFKGLLEDGEVVAVKVLHYLTPEISDQQFQNEFENLKRLKHPNIVRLVGFCDETEDEIVEHKGKLVVCERIHRALCLEYVPNGSLGKLLSGEYLGNDWPIRYKIIKGICNGLKYLREGLEVPIFHFDLKPDNILLDEKMVPKIADFGLSRLIGEGNTRKTLSPLGTVGYLPPEFINSQVISEEYDIFSLGVIIAQIITGITGYFDIADMGAQEFIDHVHENWKRSLQEIPNYEALEVDCKQVKRCIEIAINCMEKERRKRPTIKDIVRKLDEIDSHFQMKKETAQPCQAVDGDGGGGDDDLDLDATWNAIMQKTRLAALSPVQKSPQQRRPLPRAAAFFPAQRARVLPVDEEELNRRLEDFIKKHRNTFGRQWATSALIQPPRTICIYAMFAWLISQAEKYRLLICRERKIL